MKYYILKHSNNSKIIGKEFPQVHKMTSNYDYEAKNSVHALSRYFNKFPDFVPNLESFVLHPKAIITDIISAAVIGGCGFLISERFKEILSSFVLPLHKFFKAKLIHNNKLYNDYFWLHINSDYTSFVDFPNSEFCTCESFSFKTADKINIFSKEDFIIKRKNVQKSNEFLDIEATKLKMNLSFIDENLDLFKISQFDSDFYVSDFLRENIEKEMISGIDIIKNDKLS